MIDDFVLYHYCGLADGRASLSDLASFRGESLIESLPPPEIHRQPSKADETPSSDEEEDEQEERRRSDVPPLPKKSSIDFVLDERYYDAIDVDAILAQASEGREGLQQLLSAPHLQAPFESLPVVRQVGLTRKKPTHRQAQLFSTWTTYGVEKTEVSMTHRCCGCVDLCVLLVCAVWSAGLSADAVLPYGGPLDDRSGQSDCWLLQSEMGVSQFSTHALT